jgi:hypothetical protein
MHTYPIGKEAKETELTTIKNKSSISLSRDRFIVPSKVLERDYPGKVIMW